MEVLHGNSVAVHRVRSKRTDILANDWGQAGWLMWAPFCSLLEVQGGMWDTAMQVITEQCHEALMIWQCSCESVCEEACFSQPD